MTADLAQQVDPHGNDAGDDQRAAFCDGCGDTHYPGEHRDLTAPELATLRAAAQLTIAGAVYTDVYLIGRTIASRGILANTQNRSAYRAHVDTLTSMGFLELTEPTTTPLGFEGTPVDATTAALEHLTNTDRRTR